MSLKSGFTLMELMVALAMASVLSLSVLVCLGNFQKTVVNMKDLYGNESRELILRMGRANPYMQKTQD